VKTRIAIISFVSIYLYQAFDENLPVRLVVWTAANPVAIRNCTDASIFHKPSLTLRTYRKVEKFDGDEFIIDFEPG
jgi:hypothetical protein